MASFRITGRLDGVQQAIAALNEFKASVQRKILRPAMQAASSLMAKAAKQRVRTETRLLKRSIGSVVRTYPARNQVLGVIGPRRGFREEVALRAGVYRQVKGRTIRLRQPRPGMLRMVRNPAKYAHLVELGTRHRQAFPFLATAFAESKAAAEAVLIARLAQGIEREAKRLAAKGRR